MGSDTKEVKGKIPPMCDCLVCPERSNRPECYLHTYVICSYYPDTPADLMHMKDKGLEVAV